MCASQAVHGASDEQRGCVIARFAVANAAAHKFPEMSSAESAFPAV